MINCGTSKRNDKLWEIELVISQGYKNPNEEIIGAYDISKLHLQHVRNLLQRPS